MLFVQVNYAPNLLTLMTEWFNVIIFSYLLIDFSVNLHLWFYQQ